VVLVVVLALFGLVAASFSEQRARELVHDLKEKHLLDDNFEARPTHPFSQQDSTGLPNDDVSGGAFVLGTATTAKTISATTYYSLAVPAASSRMNKKLTLTATTSSTSSMQVGIKIGTSFNAFDAITVASGSFSTVFNDPIVASSCLYANLPATATNIYIYADPPSSGSSAVTLKLEESVHMCTMVTRPLNALNFSGVIVSANVDALVTIPWSVAKGQWIKLTDEASFCNSYFTTGFAAPFQSTRFSFFTTSLLWKSMGSITVLVQPSSSGTTNTTCSATFSLTPVKCSKANSTFCNEINYNTMNERMTASEALMSLAFYFLRAGTCTKDFPRASFCLTSYPPCDSDNFLAPICDRVCSMYSGCGVTSSTCAGAFSGYPVSIASSNCQGYYFSGAFSIVPSFMGVLCVVLFALVGFRFV